MYNSELNQSDFFSNLNFRNNDRMDYVIQSLENERMTIDSLISMLIIIYRLRNNLFHGLKWLNGFNYQYDFFNTANNILKLTIEDFNSNNY